jgi:hypothetical protein
MLFPFELIKIMRLSWYGYCYTLVILTEGNEILIKKPKTAPIIVTITSLMLSFGNLSTLQVSTGNKISLQRLQCYSENNNRHTNLRPRFASFAMLYYKDKARVEIHLQLTEATHCLTGS